MRHHLDRASLAAALALAACAPAATAAPPTDPSTRPALEEASTMDTEQRNRETVRRIYEEVLDAGRFERVDELVDPDYVAADGARGGPAFAARLRALRASFPDIRYTIDDLVADGDRVAVRWTWEGTHRAPGPFAAIAASGKRVKNTGMAIYTLRAGRVARVVMETDRLGFLLAVGALAPSALPAGIAGPPPATSSETATTGGAAAVK